MPKTIRVPSPKLPIDLKPKLPTTPTTTPANPQLLPKMVIDRGSGFDPSIKKRTGVPDDSVGRSTGRKTATVGTHKPGRKGVPDDSVGIVSERDSLFDTKETADQLALRASVFTHLETPSYLEDKPAPRTFTNVKSVEAALTASTNHSQADSLLALAKKTPEVGARLDGLFTSTAGLRADVRSSLLQTFAIDPAGNAGAVVEHIVKSSTFQKMSVAQQTDVAAVMGKLDEKGLTYLGALFDRAPRALLDKDSRGATLLSNLAHLATQPLNVTLARKTSTEALLSAIVREVANPNRVDQGTAPTCTVTSMQFEMVADNPSEYARLMSGLVGPAGSAHLRGGGSMKLGTTDADAAARDGRAVSQAIFQSSAMEYANGRKADFDPIARGSTNLTTGATFQGLKPAMQQSMLEHLFGVKYSTDQMSTEAEGARMLEKLRGFNARNMPNRPVILDIDQGKVNHAVTLERVSGGRVYFRDPYGSLKSMDESMFAKYVLTVHLPSELAHR